MLSTASLIACFRLGGKSPRTARGHEPRVLDSDPGAPYITAKLGIDGTILRCLNVCFGEAHWTSRGGLNLESHDLTWPGIRGRARAGSAGMTSESSIDQLRAPPLSTRTARSRERLRAQAAFGSGNAAVGLRGVDPRQLAVHDVTRTGSIEQILVDFNT